MARRCRSEGSPWREAGARADPVMRHPLAKCHRLPGGRLPFMAGQIPPCGPSRTSRARLSRAAIQSEPPASGWAARIRRRCAARISSAVAPAASPRTASASARLIARAAGRAAAPPGVTARTEASGGIRAAPPARWRRAGPPRGAEPRVGGARPFPQQGADHHQRADGDPLPPGEHEQQHQAEPGQGADPQQEGFHGCDRGPLERAQPAREGEQGKAAKKEPEHGSADPSQRRAGKMRARAWPGKPRPIVRRSRAVQRPPYASGGAAAIWISRGSGWSPVLGSGSAGLSAPKAGFSSPL